MSHPFPHVAKTILLGLTAAFVPALGQSQANTGTLDVDSTVASWQHWTPRPSEFRLYINFDNSTCDSVPRIDILDFDASHPFLMCFANDTLHVHIAPPGETQTERSIVDGLPAEFPIVLTAGNNRAVFLLCYEAHQFALVPVDTAPFLSTVEIRPLPDDIVWLQLDNTDKEASTIGQVLDRVTGRATLIQLDDGYYSGIWFPVRRDVIRRWKLNRTSLGPLLVLKVEDKETVEQVAKSLDVWRKPCR